MPTLKGTEAPLPYAQCFLYLVPSSLNVYFSYYMAGYFLDIPRVSGWVGVCIRLRSKEGEQRADVSPAVDNHDPC